MSDVDAIVISDFPNESEAEICRAKVVLMDRDLILTTAGDMAVVRIFGSDRGGNAVRLGLPPDAALRLGLAFIRAALRIKPSLKAALRVMLFKIVGVDPVADAPEKSAASE